MKNIGELTLRGFIIALKTEGFLKNIATNGLTEAKGSYPDFPINIQEIKLGDMRMKTVMTCIPIETFKALPKVGPSLIEILTEYAQVHDLPWGVKPLE